MQPRARVSILEKVREGDRETEKIRSSRNTDDRMCFPPCRSYLTMVGFFVPVRLFKMGLIYYSAMIQRCPHLGSSDPILSLPYHNNNKIITNVRSTFQHFLFLMSECL